jgi:hexosaminidase
MKNILALFLLLISQFSAIAQNPSSPKFAILPTPQVFELNGQSDIKPVDVISYKGNIDLAKTNKFTKTLKKDENSLLTIAIDPKNDIKSEGYILSIHKNEIDIKAKDKAGLFYAFASLNQLIEDAQEQHINLPICHIKDYPSLSYRSVHLDIKHHREKTSYYYDLIDELASYKINGIIAEMEDKLAYETHPLIASDDAISIKEWIKLSNYAMDRNISISPLIQGLGHASFILKHEKYKHLRDDQKSDWAFNPLDPETYELQFDLYRNAIKATPQGKYLHIGGDEVHTNGRNSGKSELELQLIWLNKVCAFAAEQGRIPIFWDDMPLKLAKVYDPMFNTKMTQSEVDKVWEENESNLLKYLDQFPKNCVYMRWNYSEPEALGNTKAMQWFVDHGLQVMGATAGQTRWALMPSEESNLRNIKTFAINSIEQGLDGLLLTLWDDDSPHFELYKRGILGFAEYCWAGDKLSVDDFKKVFRQRAFSSYLADEKYAFIDQLELKVRFWENAFMQKTKNRRYINRSDNPKDKLIIDLPNPENPGEWSIKENERLIKAAKSLEACEDIGKTITLLKQEAIRNQYTLEVYEQVNELVKYVSKSLLSLEKYDKAIDKTESEKELRELQNNFKKTRKKLEEVYGKVRILEKPANYILDQDHHAHMGNQSKNFDWQFASEMLFLEKVEEMLDKEKLVN